MLMKCAFSSKKTDFYQAKIGGRYKENWRLRRSSSTPNGCTQRSSDEALTNWWLAVPTTDKQEFIGQCCLLLQQSGRMLEACDWSTEWEKVRCSQDALLLAIREYEKAEICVLWCFIASSTETDASVWAINANSISNVIDKELFFTNLFSNGRCEDSNK